MSRLLPPPAPAPLPLPSPAEARLPPGREELAMLMPMPILMPTPGLALADDDVCSRPPDVDVAHANKDEDEAIGEGAGWTVPRLGVLLPPPPPPPPLESDTRLPALPLIPPAPTVAMGAACACACACACRPETGASTNPDALAMPGALGRKLDPSPPEKPLLLLWL